MTDNMTNTKIELSAGEMLRSARTNGRRKREISTIAKQLCIREEFLQALEDGNYSALPETVYVLGFARNYAMELGLNPDDIVIQIKRELGMNETTDDASEDDSPETGLFAMTTPDRFAFVKRWYKYVISKWKWFAGGLGAIILLVLILLLFFSGSNNSTTQSGNAVAAEQAIVEPQYNTKVRERFGTENATGANVILQATQEAWVKIEDGRNNTVFSRVLVAGDVYYVPAGNKYKATFGNAGGVDIWVNGKLAPKAGDAHTRKAGISLKPEDLLK